MTEPILSRHFTINGNKQPSALSYNMVLARQINHLNQALKAQLPKPLNQLNLTKLADDVAVFTINSPAIAFRAHNQIEVLSKILNSVQNNTITDIKIKVAY